MPKPNILNVREHLKLVGKVIEVYRKYGQCPLVDDAIVELSLYNRAILRKHNIYLMR